MEIGDSLSERMEYLHVNYRGVLLAIVRRFLPVHNYALSLREDAYQEALIAAAEGLSGYDPDKCGGTLVHWIAWRAKDRLRNWVPSMLWRLRVPRQRSNSADALRAREDAFLSEVQIDVEMDTETASTDLLDLREAIADLAPRLRQVIEMRLAGHSNIEIARELDCSESWAVQLYNRALHGLRARLVV